MKKIMIAIACVTLFLASSNTVFAANHVSTMAVAKGGQHIAKCAQEMNKGISECINIEICE